MYTLKGKFPKNDKILYFCFLCIVTKVGVKVKLKKIFIYLKVPKREIFDRSNFPDFYAIKSSWVGDLVVKILTYYFNF